MNGDDQDMEKDVKNWVTILGKMARIENALTELYRRAGVACASDADFWGNMAGEEANHAAVIGAMANLVIKRKGAGFSSNRVFTVAALDTFQKIVEGTLSSLKDGKLNGKKVYYAAKDLESALMETRYWQLLKTEDQGYMDLMRLVEDETMAHRARLEERIRSLQPGE